MSPLRTTGFTSVRISNATKINKNHTNISTRIKQLTRRVRFHVWLQSVVECMTRSKKQLVLTLLHSTESNPFHLFHVAHTYNTQNSDVKETTNAPVLEAAWSSTITAFIYFIFLCFTNDHTRATPTFLQRVCIADRCNSYYGLSVHHVPFFLSKRMKIRSCGFQHWVRILLVSGEVKFIQIFAGDHP